MGSNRKHHVLKGENRPFYRLFVPFPHLESYVDVVDTAFAKPIAIYSNISLSLRPRKLYKVNGHTFTLTTTKSTSLSLAISSALL